MIAEDGQAYGLIFFIIVSYEFDVHVLMSLVYIRSTLV